MALYLSIFISLVILNVSVNGFLLHKCNTANLKLANRSFLRMSNIVDQSTIVDVSSPSVPSKLLENNEDFSISSEWERIVENLGPLLLTSSVLLLGSPMASYAQAGAYGLFEGKAASLLHPLTMFALFGTSVYSGVLGLKYKRLRELPSEIKRFTDQLPTISTGKVSSPLSPEISRITREITLLQGNEDNDTPEILRVLNKDLSSLKSALSIDQKVVALSTERKDLLNGNVRDKHWLTGSILLSTGVTVSILGAFNTFLRTGKLFPGPHLYAGMGITILWAIAASMVPFMQKGNDTARTVHIAANTVNVVLFAWQVATGIEILLKVWEKTPW